MKTKPYSKPTAANNAYWLHWISRNWFQVILGYLALQFVLKNEVAFQVAFGDTQVVVPLSTAATANGNPPPARKVAAVYYPAQNVSQFTASQSGAAPAVPVSSAPPAPPASSEPTFSISNLTPVLSPGYAARKRIPAAVVAEKLQVVNGYVTKFSPMAVKAMQDHGIPASITLAQGLLESNAGGSKLARESNNHFGIKCRSKCRGCTCRNYTDDDVYDMFRVFPSAWDSYAEHAELLTSRRYAHLKKFGRDYKSWAHGLKRAGYATDPRYAQKLIQIIENLKLYHYDGQA